MVVTEPGCDNTVSGQMWPHQIDDESSSSSSSDNQKYNSHMGRKRKATSSYDEDDSKESKKVKNREAARRCREKKQRQTEELRKKNQELEKDNCNLAKQKEQLIEMCRKYQEEIEQHKDQGCMVPHFDPPYNIDSLLNPATPPSPSFSVSTHSECASPSISPSVSPGPPTRYMTCRPVTTQQLEADTLETDTATAAASSKLQMHRLLIRKQDGSIGMLRLSHEDYKIVKQRLKAVEEKKKQQQQEEEWQREQQKRQPLQLPTFTSTSQPEKQMPFLPQMPHDPPINIGTTQSLIGAQEKQGVPELSTTDYNDILTALQNNANDLDLMPVDPNEVLNDSNDLLVKQEPTESGYELGFEDVEVKQENMAEQVQAASSSQWSSTGEHIRAGMDTLTQQEHLTPTSQSIQNIVQYLKHGQNDTLTITDPMPNLFEETTARSACLNVVKKSDYDKQMPSSNSSLSGKRVMLITSTAPMGSLGMKVPSTSMLVEEAKPRKAMTVPTMPNIKIRPNAANKLTSVASDSLEVPSETTPARSSQNVSGANPGTASQPTTACSSGQVMTFIAACESQENQASTGAPLQFNHLVSASSVPQPLLAENNVLIVSSPNTSGAESKNLGSDFTFCLNNYSIEAMESNSLNG